MNEQMKQLMGQTLDEKFAGTWSTMDLLDLQKFAERFAELIVRECAEVCHKLAEDSDSYVVHDGDTCAEQIKKHFGVKE